VTEMDDPDDPVASLLGAAIVRRLRLRDGLERAAELAGLSVKTLQRYEKGEATPPPKTLALLARAAGFSSALLERIQRPLEAHQLASAGGLAGDPAGDPALRRRPFSSLPADITAEVLQAVEEAAGLLVLEPAPAPWEETGRPRPEDRIRAGELWRRFLGEDRDERYRLVRESSAFRLWSFAERLAQESEAAAADSPAEALEIARLSLEIARAVRGTPSWRARVEAFALSSLGKALLAGNEPDQARAAFAQARALRADFSPSDPPLLDETRL
jgi:transcriptional regulator with XRE-family HTH domain